MVKLNNLQSGWILAVLFYLLMFGMGLHHVARPEIYFKKPETTQVMPKSERHSRAL